MAQNIMIMDETSANLIGLGMKQEKWTFKIIYLSSSGSSSYLFVFLLQTSSVCNRSK